MWVTDSSDRRRRQVHRSLAHGEQSLRPLQAIFIHTIDNTLTSRCAATSRQQFCKLKHPLSSPYTAAGSLDSTYTDLVCNSLLRPPMRQPELQQYPPSEDVYGCVPRVSTLDFPSVYTGMLLNPMWRSTQIYGSFITGICL